MTLCIAWIRDDIESQELVFATDSMLTGGGETWRHGIKLFELPRKDCLLCFAGETQKAYPLALNLTSSLKFDEVLQNQNTDLRDVLEHLCELFSELINTLKLEINAGEDYNPFTATSFIFGGWNWKLKLLEFWEIYYNLTEKRFLYKGQNSKDPRAYLMIGDHLTEAEDLLAEELVKNNKRISGALDMEPFIVLSKMSRDTSYRSIDGAIQLAKVYSSGTSEFFGIMWPSVSGKFTFLGRNLNPYLKPHIRFIDPDTGNILDSELPDSISSIDIDTFGEETDFIKICYPDGNLKPNLPQRQKEMLLSIFKDNSYKQFLYQLTVVEKSSEKDEQ